MYLNLNGGPDNRNLLIAYADVNRAESKIVRKSNYSSILLFNGCAVCCACKKQTCMPLSPTEAEFINLSEAAN